MLLRHLMLGTMIIALVAVACSDSGAKTTAPNGGGAQPGATGGSNGDDSEMSGGNQLVWGPAPPIFPKGAQFAVVEGDPGKAGDVFTVRLRFPNGYILPPHTHPADEYVTVLKGTFLAGMGEDFSDDALVGYKVDDFVTMPANMAHFASARGSTEVQVHGVGPFALTYVHPQDDPTK
jgi:quercetin dioxygenase-like cupin family protein